MTATFRWILSTSLGLLLAALLVLTAGTAWTPRADAATRASEAHPYSDPVWFPLRDTAKVGCAKSGCNTQSDHGYFAIDFLGQKDDPVYAAGAGVAHIGANDGSCSSSSTTESDGRWVWIDHGAGVVSRYHHLNHIAIKEGQLVTPATQIGGMGNTGDVPPCGNNYLHFEVRAGGLKGERVDFGSLRGCQGSKVVSLPEVFGFSSWNAQGMHPQKRFDTPVLDNDCIGSAWQGTPATPQVTMTRGDGHLSIGANLPQGAERWMAYVEIYRPSIKTWRPLEYRTSSTAQRSTTFTGLENSRRYRVAVTVRNGAGWSAWSRTTEVKATPGAPGTRYLSWKRTSSSKKSYLHYGWTRPESYGSTVDSFVVSRRCGSSTTTYGAWKSYRQGTKDTFRNIKKLGKAKTCQVRVQAVNDAGAGPWSATKTVRR